MSRERGDGMGDIIRKAAPPPGEGSYKKVKGSKRDRKEPLCASRRGMLRECCPDPAQAGGIGGLEQGEPRVCKVFKPPSFPLALSPEDKTAGRGSKGFSYLQTPGVLRCFVTCLKKV